MSCSTPRQLVKSEQESVVNKDVQSAIDSVAQNIVETNIDELLEQIDNIETEIVLFDTDKPVVDSTGLPPVKAIVRQKAKTEAKQTTAKQEKQKSEAQVEKKIDDRSTEEVASVTETEEKATWWETLKKHLMRIILIPVILIVIWVVYKFFKLVK